MAQTAFGIYAVRMGGASPLVVDQVQDQEVRGGLDIMQVYTGGDIVPTSIFSRNVRPIIRFRTTAVDSALTNFGGVDGIAIAAASPFEAYFRKRLAGGTYAGAGAHVRVQVFGGMIVPRMIRARQGELAEIEYEVVVIGDGTNVPIGVQKDQSLAPTTTTTTQMYTNGPAWVNGTKVDMVGDIDIDFGLDIAAIEAAGVPYPKLAFIRRIAPKITFKTLDMDLITSLDDISGFANFGMAGKLVESVTRVFLTKREMPAENYADADTQHLRFEMSNGFIHPERAAGQNQDDAIADIVITGRATIGVTASPLVYTSSVAINGT